MADVKDWLAGLSDIELQNVCDLTSKEMLKRYPSMQQIIDDAIATTEPGGKFELLHAQMDADRAVKQ